MPSIVTSSLQLYLIASDTGSYSGSGTTWTDLSPNAYNTTIVGGPAFNTTHFNFDGTIEYIDTNQSLDSNNFSVGAWFRTTSGGIKMILSKETTGGWPWNYRIWLNGGTIIGDIALSGGQNQSISSVLSNYNNGSWYYVMFTRDDSNLYLYVNGVQVKTQADTMIGSITNSQELWVGRSAFTSGGANPSGSYQFIGDIAEVFVYDNILTSTEVLENFDNTKHTYYPPTPTPTLSATLTPTPTPTLTPTNTTTLTPTSTTTDTPTPTPTTTSTNTPTLTPTLTPTITSTNTPTLTSTPTPTITSTNTPTLTSTPTVTSTNTPTLTQTLTNTPTLSSTNTPTPTNTPTITPTRTSTPTLTQTLTPTPTTTLTPTATARPLLKIRPILVDSYQFPLGISDTIQSGTGSEIVQPYDARYFVGQIVPLTASQNKYSLDYFRIYPPNEIVRSQYWFIANQYVPQDADKVRDPNRILTFTASFDPRTIVRINNTGSVSGSNSGIEIVYR
jgi:hypothetical protein